MTNAPRDGRGEGAADADAFAAARAAVLAQPGRDHRGRWTEGNAGALKTGTRSRQVLDTPELVAAVRDRAEAITADLGGMSQLSAAKAALVGELARVQLIAESLGHEVLAHGVITGKGKVRSATNVYLAVLDRQVRLAALVGLDRQTKPATFADAMRQEPVRG